MDADHVAADHPAGAENLHGWFGLSYASYLVLPRSILREMPDEWQGRLYDLLQELGDRFPFLHDGATYDVRLRDDETGKYVTDRLAAYRHPDRPYIEAIRRP